MTHVLLLSLAMLAVPFPVSGATKARVSKTHLLKRTGEKVSRYALTPAVLAAVALNVGLMTEAAVKSWAGTDALDSRVATEVTSPPPGWKRVTKSWPAVFHSEFCIGNSCYSHSLFTGAVHRSGRRGKIGKYFWATPDEVAALTRTMEQATQHSNLIPDVIEWPLSYLANGFCNGFALRHYENAVDWVSERRREAVAGGEKHEALERATTAR